MDIIELMPASFPVLLENMGFRGQNKILLDSKYFMRYSTKYKFRVKIKD